LVPDRTSAPWWQDYTPRSDLVLFVRHKIKFIDVDGTPGVSPAQGTCLLAIGARGCAALEHARAAGLGVLMRPDLGLKSENLGELLEQIVILSVPVCHVPLAP
jgi:hypothetical protein